MDGRTLERIFDPLFTTREEGKGSGLGLAMVETIVAQYGGTISVRSRPGQGTTFSMVFAGQAVAPPDPARDAPVATASDVGSTLVKARQSSPAHTPSVAPASLPDEAATGAFHVLLCDDDESVLDVMARTLEKLGYSVTALGSGEAALEAFRAAPDDFDLVLTDQMMPGMTGLDLLVRIRDVRRDLPAVLTTGLVGSVSRQELARLRCGLLPKPATTNQLGEAVALGLRRGFPPGRA
jgi:CheY-like chemotaxis protein